MDGFAVLGGQRPPSLFTNHSSLFTFNIMPPFVYIIGAGPGDPELLTLKAHKLLTEKAEVVVHDRLIADEIMAMIPESAERIFAGKSCKNHCMTQEEINQCLVDQAKRGKVVVRLKGGDPFIFGRGGEEAEYLAEYGIPFEVVPGVSSATACSAYAGIPLTHRGLSHSVRYITGHRQKETDPLNLDWHGLADPDTTLVIYMGLVNIEVISEKLIAHGLKGDTPAAAIQNGTTPNERKAFTTLADLPSMLKQEGFAAPTLIIIGRVVGMAERLG